MIYLVVSYIGMADGKREEAIAVFHEKQCKPLFHWKADNC